MLVRSLLSPVILRQFISYPFSQLVKHPLIGSQFFQVGPRSTPSNKPMSKLFNTTFSQIQKLQALLQQKSQRLLKKFRQEQLTKELSRPSEQNSEIKQYLQTYRSLMEAIQKSRIENEQTYNIIGWYNMIPLKRTLVQKLFSSTVEEIPQIIESLSWMDTNQASIEEFFQSKEDYLEKYKKFYRKLPFTLTIDQLKKLDEILKPTSYLQQRKFYQAYLRYNLENILRDVHSSREQQFVEDIIWLLETSLKAMNDSEINISKIEKFILTWRPKITAKSLQKLMKVYSEIGRANPLIYELHLKPYILRQKMKQAGGWLQTLKFIVYSQLEDKEILNVCFEQTNIQFNKKSISQAQINELHTLVHYINIKGEKTNLNKGLQKKLHQNCKAENCISFLNSFIFKNKSNKGTISKMKKSSPKYISQCLQEKTDKNIKKVQQFQKEELKDQYSFHLPGTNFSEIDIYKNVTFCNFKIDYFLFNRNKNEVIDVQTDCQAYTFNSGQLRRGIQMRDQIMEHYGIKVKHINTQKYQVKERKLSQQESMMMPSQKKKTKI